MAQQEVGGPGQLAGTLLRRQLGHHLSGLLAIVGDPPAVEVRGQCHEPLVGQPVCDVLDVVGQPPPFLDDDHSRSGAEAGRAR